MVFTSKVRDVGLFWLFLGVSCHSTYSGRVHNFEKVGGGLLRKIPNIGEKQTSFTNVKTSPKTVSIVLRTFRSSKIVKTPEKVVFHLESSNFTLSLGHFCLPYLNVPTQRVPGSMTKKGGGIF